MSKLVTWTLEPRPSAAAERARRRVARWLLRSGHALARLARRLHVRTETPADTAPVFEFYAESGAPEGALFVDGQRVGVLDGVTRL